MKFFRKNRYENITREDIDKYLLDNAADPAVEVWVKKPNTVISGAEISRIQDKFHLKHETAQQVTSLYFPEYEDKLESLDREVDLFLSAVEWYKRKK